MSKRPAAIDQFLPSYAVHDAIGTHTTYMQKLLKERGFESRIFYELYREETADVSQSFEFHPPLSSSDNIAIYHHSIGCGMAHYLLRMKEFGVVLYHNITPAKYFKKLGDEQTYEACCEGVRQLTHIKLSFDKSWAVSQYSADELAQHGFQKPGVFPLLRDYNNLLALNSDPQLAKSLNDGKKNLLFVGRISPHKCQHDLMFLLKAYQNTFKERVRLVLVGGASSYYRPELMKLASKLQLKVCSLVKNVSSFDCDADVVILEQISDEQLATVYRNSHVFTCLSEHEGFCVPLIEAMTFGLPVIVHDAAAVPETAGRAAFVYNKDTHPEQGVMRLHQLFSDKADYEKQRILSLDRAKDFEWSKLVVHFDKCLTKLLKNFSDARS